MPDLPSGTVTFLFTDIEGSTRLWERDPDTMRTVVARHDALLNDAISAHQGFLYKHIGDAIQAAFFSASDALAAAVAAQRAMGDEPWSETGPLRVRMALHTGEAAPDARGDYHQIAALNRLARLLAAGHGGQILLTDTTRNGVHGVLPDGITLIDLGKHRLRDLLEPERVSQVVIAGLPHHFPPLKSLERHPTNLPVQPNELIGRDRDLAVLRHLLTEETVRLVTLTGPGGTGKTRLALQAGAELLDHFEDGIFVVDLAPLMDPTLVLSTIATTLGVREGGGLSLRASVDAYLAEKQLLLILDNYEHLLDATPVASDLLAASPGLRILATSRAALRLGAEREYPVAPLGLPSTQQGRLGDLYQPAAAVALFVQRAQAVKPDFALTEENAATVAAICARLDGLPLAIELAAARVRVLPPAQLLTRLATRLKVLTDGHRDLPARQQTLRATLAWSHDLLEPDEQTLFARLAVFAGGCTFEAAEAVCGASGDLALDVLDGLDSLTQKSLLRPEDGADSEPRFTMLETIREYGLEQLDANGDADTIRHAHADFFLALAETAESQLTSSDQVAWLNRLGAEHDNFRSALGWLEQGGGVERRLRIASALWRFWWMRGHLTEGRGWLERALAGANDRPPAILANALSSTGILAESQGDYERAIVLHEQALDLRRSIGDQVGIASSLTSLGIIQRNYGNYDRSSALHQQALALWRELDNERGIAGSVYEMGLVALYRGHLEEAAPLLHETLDRSRKLGDASAVAAVFESLGILAFYQENYPQAAAYYEESLAVCRHLNDSRMIASLLANLGEVRSLQGQVVDAEALYEEALTLFRELGEKRGLAFVLLMLGKVNVARNDLDKASLLFVESLTVRRDAGETPAVIESLEALAQLAWRRGEAALGVRLLAAADAHRLTIGAPLAASYAVERERVLTDARRSLGEAAFAAEWTRGQALSLDEAITDGADVAPGVTDPETSAIAPRLLA